MGALEAVLALREEKERRNAATADAISQGFQGFVNSFVQARKARQEEEMMGLTREKYRIDELVALGTLEKQNRETALLSQFLGDGSQSGGFKPKGISVGGVTFEDPEFTRQEKQMQNDMAIELERQKKAIQGPGAESGKVALAQESIKNIEDVKKILFPTGKAESFERGIAFKSNLPGNTVPILRNIMPDVAPLSEKGQEVFRKMGASLSARQLIQTGVAARPEETAKLVAQFAPNMASNPKAALDGLNELQSFYEEYLNTVDPTGAKLSGISGKKQQVSLPSRSSAPKGAKGWDTEKQEWVF